MRRALPRSVKAFSTLRRLPGMTVSAQARPKPIRMGFMLDIVGYSRRDARAQELLQQRLVGVVRLVLDDLRVEPSDIDHQGTGDGLLVILPERVDVHRVLPALLASTTRLLAGDNAMFRDRVRVRMAADIGPVRIAELGFEGAMVTNMARLLDSRPLRDWVDEHPERDLSVALSDSMHRFVVAEGTPELPAEQFTQVHVQVNEAMSTGWLWTC
jgi:hypothetical protein